MITSHPAGGRAPQQAAHVCAAFLDDEVVLYDVHRARPLLLNATAAAVWAAIDGARTADAIAADLAQRFEADPRHVRDDVAATLLQFAELGLLA
ncbi:MAG: HPr-rel-A system PqqD family peptide chaperone [Actinomycetota bacterium]|nr:HPr-rel-A system PqqD family peptide chaperone [Actinomycetota bacterium]